MTDPIPLMARAEALERSGVHLGAPARLFVDGGRKQLIALLSLGLTPQSRVLDIGCGALRAGYWLIHFLEPERYFGIEPDGQMLDGGVQEILEPALLQAKRPRFDRNDRLQFNVFENKFDYFLARSIWTHAPKRAITDMLDGFVANATQGAVFLTSFLPASRWRGDDYQGSTWRFVKTADAGESGMLRHSLRWIRNECRSRKLDAKILSDPVLDFGGQTWLEIRQRAS